MPYVIEPRLYPTEGVLDEFRQFSKEDLFARLSEMPRLRAIEGSSQLDKLPTDLNLLAAFHGVKSDTPWWLYVLVVFSLLNVGVVGFPLIVGYAVEWFIGLDPVVAQIIGFGGFAMLLIVGVFFITERRAQKAKANEPKIADRAAHWHKQGGMRLGMGWMVVDKPQYALGDTIRFIYSQKVVKPTQLQGGAVRLVLYEASRHDVITYEIHHQDYAELARVEIPARSYRADERLQVRGEFTLPDHAPSVLITPSHRMAYLLVVTLDVAEQPTTDLLYHLPVQPSVEVDKVERFV